MNQKQGPDYIPYSEHMERVVLGAMMLDAVALTSALNRLTEKDFYLSANQKLFAVFRKLHADGINVDSVTVYHHLKATRQRDAVGGEMYIALLTDGIPYNLEIGSYIRLLRETSIMRTAVKIHYEGYEDAAAWEENPRKFVQDSIHSLQVLITDAEEATLRSVSDVLSAAGPPESAVDRLAKLNGVRLGFSQLDDATHGGGAGELWVIAARPSMGKTAFMCNGAATQALSGKVTAVFSFEQPKEAIIRRAISARSRINATHILTGSMSSREREIFLEYQRELMGAPLYIDDTMGLTVTNIRAAATKLKQQQGQLDGIWIDQLSFIENFDIWEKGVNDATLIGRQCKALKLMGKDLGCPVYLLVQLNRDVNKRTDPKPRLSDLAESGRIEQTGDVIAFLHRPEYYDRTDETLKGKGQIILAKNREGAIGDFDCDYIASILRWEDPTPPATEQRNFYGSGDNW